MQLDRLALVSVQEGYRDVLKEALEDERFEKEALEEELAIATAEVQDLRKKYGECDVERRELKKVAATVDSSRKLAREMAAERDKYKQEAYNLRLHTAQTTEDSLARKKQADDRHGAFELQLLALKERLVSSQTSNARDRSQLTKTIESLTAELHEKDAALHLMKEQADTDQLRSQQDLDAQLREALSQVTPYKTLNSKLMQQLSATRAELEAQRQAASEAHGELARLRDENYRLKEAQRMLSIGYRGLKGRQGAGAGDKRGHQGEDPEELLARLERVIEVGDARSGGSVVHAMQNARRAELARDEEEEEEEDDDKGEEEHGEDVHADNHHQQREEGTTEDDVWLLRQCEADGDQPPAWLSPALQQEKPAPDHHHPAIAPPDLPESVRAANTSAQPGSRRAPSASPAATRTDSELDSEPLDIYDPDDSDDEASAAEPQPKPTQPHARTAAPDTVPYHRQEQPSPGRERGGGSDAFQPVPQPGLREPVAAPAPAQEEAQPGAGDQAEVLEALKTSLADVRGLLAQRSRKRQNSASKRSRSSKGTSPAASPAPEARGFQSCER